jgi:hypothetical protein
MALPINFKNLDMVLWYEYEIFPTGSYVECLVLSWRAILGSYGIF